MPPMIPRDVVMTKLVSFLQDENGSNAIEYSLLVTLLGVALIGVFSTFAADVGSIFQTLTTGL
jgi:Flp pilus assembly pilin Flp